MEITVENNTIMILGGYGLAGLTTARLLLQETSVRLILAGRNLNRAMDAAKQLNTEFAGDRVRGIQVDASDLAALRTAFRDCDLVMVCIPVTGIGGGVAQAAFDAGVDYLDLNLDEKKQQVLKQLSEPIEQAGLCFLTEAGAWPGLPSMLVRLAANRFDSLQNVTVAAIMNETNVTYGSAVDLIAHISSPSFVYEGGAWRRASLTSSQTVDFGAPFGRRTCYPVDLIEMRSLPERLGIEEAGVYIAGGGGFVDLLSLVWNVFRLGKYDRTARLGAKLLVWGARCARPPYGFSIKMDAVGEVAGRREQFDVSLQHDDGYAATAISIVACFLQLLDGSIEEPGVRIMGHAVDPNRFVQDLQRLGMKISTTTVELEQ